MMNYTPNLPGFKSPVGRRKLSLLTRFKRELDSAQKYNVTQYRNLFQGFIPFEEFINNSSTSNSRKRIFTFEITFWAFFTQILYGNKSCREAVKSVQSWFITYDEKAPSSNTSAYCRARKRLSYNKLMTICRNSITKIVSVVEPELWCNRVVKIVDGTSFKLPDTDENQREYPQPTSQKPGCGFPQIKVQGLICLATGILLDWCETPLASFDGAGWKGLWNRFPKGDVILADRAYGSYVSIALLAQKGIDVISRMHQMRKLNKKTAERLGNGDWLVTWNKPLTRPKYITLAEWKTIPKKIKIRVIEYRVDIDGFRTERVFLSTALLDAESYTWEGLVDLYSRRWTIELRFRDIKSTMQMSELKGRTPDIVRKEIVMMAITYNAVKALMCRAGKANSVDVSRISFAGTVSQICHWTCNFSGKIPLSGLMNLISLFNDSLTDHKVSLRPNRSEPRAINRRAKHYKLLNKPRPEMVVEDKREYPKKLA